MSMDTIELARKLAALGQKKDAEKAYSLVIAENADPSAVFEAAIWLLRNGADYRISYSAFVRLFRAGRFRNEILDVMVRAFYEPNVGALEKRYRRNCGILKKYPYLFRKDFPSFEELPLMFFPYQGRSEYVPFDTREGRFLDYVDTENPVVSRNFFKDLNQPILAENVFSQYELAYLRDNVRPSEYVGRDNHIYLSYPDWDVFCSWLQVLDWKPLLESRKFVFLIGADIERYPLDFQAEFGVDYRQYPARPVGVREVHKLIWHAQLSTHNGGDFFNEVFDFHPNLLAMPSLMLENVEENVSLLRRMLSPKADPEESRRYFADWKPDLKRQLYELDSPSDKDLMVALFLREREWMKAVDPNARIAPAVFFQPHFGNVHVSFEVTDNNAAVLTSEELNRIRAFRPFQEFRYVKIFMPLRRFTNSYAATVRYMALQPPVEADGKVSVIPDVITQRVLNRCFMRDPQDRLFRDSVVVRFEDAKFNPKATFTRLAAFLDIPYADSMTYCSEKGAKDPVTPRSAVGFDTTTTNWTWPFFANGVERAYVEYFLRDAYDFYGYSLDYYDGAPVDEARAAAWIRGFQKLDGFMRKSWELAAELEISSKDGVSSEEIALSRKELVDAQARSVERRRLENTSVLLRNPRFVSKRGTPLEMIPLLKPDPNLLEQPLYWERPVESGDAASRQKGTLYFFTGLSGAGKSTIGGLFFQRMQERGKPIILIDGDRRRERFGATSSGDFSFGARLIGARSMFRRCKALTDEGKDVVCCSISMFHEIRVWNRLHIERYREIYIKASMETLYQRDQRGLYSSGAPNVVGVNIPWEEPSRSDIVIENDGQETPLEIVERIEKAFGIV